MASSYPPPILSERQDAETEAQSPSKGSFSGASPYKKLKDFEHVPIENFDHASADADVLETAKYLDMEYEDNASITKISVIFCEVLIGALPPRGPLDGTYAWRPEARRLLESNEVLRDMVKECWKKGKFEEIRTLAMFRPSPPPRGRVASSLRLLPRSPSEDSEIGT